MKTLVVLGILFAYAQATSDPSPSDEEVMNAFFKCAQENNLDPEKVGKMMKNEILPEDNPELTNFLYCGWKRFDCVTDDGVFHSDNIEARVIKKALLKTSDVKVAEKITKDAVEHCKDAAEGDSIGLQVIRYRNCIHQYVKDAQV